MKEFKGKFLIWIYLFIILPLNLVSHMYELPLLELISKPLLMPLLVAFVISNTAFPNPLTHLLLGALAFSWIGDLALLFDSVYSNLFIVGLVGFLIAHIQYVILFAKSAKFLSFVKGFTSLGILSFAIYTGLLLQFLWPYLHELKMPVFVYASVLMLMGIFAISRYEITGKWVVVMGAILFVLSDSILALNKFYSPMFLGRALTMFTYAIAQLLIVLGVLKALKFTPIWLPPE